MNAERERLLEMINAAWMCQAIGAACELGVADRLASGAADVPAMASELRVEPGALRRLLRALATLGVVEDGDRVCLTARGRLLVDGAEGSLRDWALMSASRGWSAWTHLVAGLKSGRNVRDAAALAALGELEGSDAERFNRAMVGLTRPVALALARKIEFTGSEAVVDVGGGSGHLLLPLLERHPRMRARIADLPHAKDLAERTLRESGVASRCEFVAGSFFDGVPAGGDVYVLKSVLHNWDDERARDILRRCRAAMRPGARLLVIERVLPERAAETPIDRENARSDLQMLLACDGRERSAREFGALLGDAGLRMEQITALTPLVSAIEARA